MKTKLDTNYHDKLDNFLSTTAMIRPYFYRVSKELPNGGIVTFDLLGTLHTIAANYFPLALQTKVPSYDTLICESLPQDGDMQALMHEIEINPLDIGNRDWPKELSIKVKEQILGRVGGLEAAKTYAFQMHSLINNPDILPAIYNNSLNAECNKFPHPLQMLLYYHFMNYNDGVDTFLQNYFTTNNKTIRSLESIVEAMEDQIDLYKGKTIIEQTKAVNSLVEEETTKLEQENINFTTEIEGQYLARALPAETDPYVIKRNKAWMDKIKQHTANCIVNNSADLDHLTLDDQDMANFVTIDRTSSATVNEKLLIAVGAGHLNGNEGLLELLSAEGYTIGCYNNDGIVDSIYEKEAVELAGE